MNPYFLFFSVYAVLILPLTFRFRLRLGRRSGYRFRVQAAGLPLARRREPDDLRDERPIQEKKVTAAIATVDPALVRALLGAPVRERVFKALRLEALAIDARMDFASAGATALWYTAALVLLRALRLAGALPPSFRARLTADFDGEGAELLLEGILTLRLGSLFPAAARFAAAYLQNRALMGPPKGASPLSAGGRQ